MFFPILPTLWAELPFTPTRWHCLFSGPFLYALKKMHFYLPGQHLGNSKPELLPYVVPLFTPVSQERFWSCKGYMWPCVSWQRCYLTFHRIQIRVWQLLWIRFLPDTSSAVPLLHAIKDPSSPGPVVATVWEATVQIQAHLWKIGIPNASWRSGSYAFSKVSRGPEGKASWYSSFTQGTL